MSFVQWQFPVFFAAVLVVFYKDKMEVASLMSKARAFYGLPSSRPIRIVDMSGQDLTGRTVREAGLLPGDAVQALLA